MRKKYDEQIEDQNNRKEIVGTAAASTKVLISGKVLGKPIANRAKQEWMQARKNKYQRDNRGYIIDNAKDKEAHNVKGKNEVEAVATKNKFDAFEVEEIEQPTLRINNGKGDDKYGKREE